ncbi:hypothetical protein [Proteiniphilum sp. X52]|uniref:hypothetical protein n=1 Tax=Proteiniphilum sp. X52 TaxID=2382159 RepID=UPI002100F44F|nr:hypothetical protein [Proteiniphilum sp. X52]
MPQATQILRHPGYSIERGVHVLLVCQLHQLFIVRALFTGRIVEAAAGNIQDLTLAGNAQWVRLVDL